MGESFMPNEQEKIDLHLLKQTLIENAGKLDLETYEATFERYVPKCDTRELSDMVTSLEEEVMRTDPYRSFLAQLPETGEQLSKAQPNKMLAHEAALRLFIAATIDQELSSRPEADDAKKNEALIPGSITDYINTARLLADRKDIAGVLPFIQDCLDRAETLLGEIPESNNEKPSLADMIQTVKDNIAS